MRLADFIDAHMPAILAEWEAFASTLLPAASGLDAAALRDHAEQILHAVAMDLRTAQTARQQAEKAQGRDAVLPGADETAAQTHAVLRAVGGFSIRQLVAEYRALRASVLRLWAAQGPHDAQALQDTGRFNEAIDQAIAESVDFFSSEVERWRAVFLGVLGHDLRGPLNSLLLTSQLIAELGRGTPVSDHSGKLVRSGERMRQLLDDLLDYNRATMQVGIRVNPQPVDLAAACREEIEMLRTGLQSSPIEYVAAATLRGSWDASRMRQVLSNLVINAARHGHHGAAIKVTLQGTDGRVDLAVESSGPDIPRERLGALFEPMARYAPAQDSEQREGLGLGLFIVREVVAAHGGEVGVESQQGRTTFRVTVPWAKLH